MLNMQAGIDCIGRVVHMAESDFESKVSKLVEESRIGKVENETAMQVFSDAYKLLPRGGSVHEFDERLSFENGQSARHQIRMRPAGYLVSNLEMPSVDAAEKCPLQTSAFGTMDCLRKEFGVPLKEESRTVFDTGVETHSVVERSRSFLWKEPVVSNEFRSWQRVYGNVSLYRTDDGKNEQLSLTRKLAEGGVQELIFSRPNSYAEMPVRFKGLKESDGDGNIGRAPRMLRLIGMHGS